MKRDTVTHLLFSSHRKFLCFTGDSFPEFSFFASFRHLKTAFLFTTIEKINIFFLSIDEHSKFAESGVGDRYCCMWDNEEWVYNELIVRSAHAEFSVSAWHHEPAYLDKWTLLYRATYAATWGLLRLHHRYTL